MEVSTKNHVKIQKVVDATWEEIQAKPCAAGDYSTHPLLAWTEQVSDHPDWHNFTSFLGLGVDIRFCSQRCSISYVENGVSCSAVFL